MRSKRDEFRCRESDCSCGCSFPPVTQDDVLRVLSYDQATGVFMHLVDGPKRKAGARAGAPMLHGYRRLTVCGFRIMEHRLAWLVMTGSMPHSLIDHIDGDGTNNSWSNLRKANKSQNGANMVATRKTKSGVKGVVPTQNGRWNARVMVKRNWHCFGTFDTIEDARRAYEDGSKRLFGEFARS